MRIRLRACRGLPLFVVSLLCVLLLSACLRMSSRATGPPARIPQFPWPPPWASATEVIPREMLEAEHDSTRLRDVDRAITEALEQNGYYESSYYAVPAGFALVTKIEQITGQRA